MPPNTQQLHIKKSHNQKDREKTLTSPVLLHSSSLKANELQQENIPIKMISECATNAVDGQGLNTIPPVIRVHRDIRNRTHACSCIQQRCAPEKFVQIHLN